MLQIEIKNELVSHLVGSSKDTTIIEELTTMLGREPTQEELEDADETLFCCDDCGWWFDIEDLSEAEDEQLCLDCYAARE